MTSALPHILVVDDDPRLLELLQRYLRRHGHAVTTAPDAATARSRLAQFAFDALVVDVMLPDRDGIALTREVRALSDVPILMLTARDAPEDRIRGLEAGADDYLGKPFEPKELLLRLSNLLRRAGTRPAPLPRVLRFGAFTFDPDTGELRRDGEAVRLTPAERALLEALARAPGTPLSRAELAERAGIQGSDRAVDVQITRLRRKLGEDPRQPRHLVTVRGEGYALLVDEPEPA